MLLILQKKTQQNCSVLTLTQQPQSQEQVACILCDHLSFSSFKRNSSYILLTRLTFLYFTLFQVIQLFHRRRKNYQFVRSKALTSFRLAIVNIHTFSFLLCISTDYWIPLTEPMFFCYFSCALNVYSHTKVSHKFNGRHTIDKGLLYKKP